MRCKDVEKQLLPNIDGNLPTETANQIKAHLQGCAKCQKTYEFYQQTDQALWEFGDAVQAGQVDMEPRSLPEPSFWERVWDSFQIPIPLWTTASLVTAGLMITLTISIFLGINEEADSISQGATRNIPALGNVSPLSSKAMLNFLFHPDDAIEINSVIELIEDDIKDHPDDLALRVKLVELYSAKLKLQSLPESERTTLKEKLTVERQRVVELFRQRGYMKGDENVEE